MTFWKTTRHTLTLTTIALLTLLITAACSPAATFDVDITDGRIDPATLRTTTSEDDAEENRPVDDTDIVNKDSLENPHIIELRSDDASRTVRNITDENVSSYTEVDGQPATRAYLTIENNGSTVTLIDITTDAADEVTFVQTVDAGEGTERLDETNSLTIDSGVTLTMTGDNIHILLIGLNGNIEEGDTVDMTLLFESGDTVDASVDVANVGW